MTLSIDDVFGVDHRSLEPGALEDHVQRETPIGLLEYEQAPAGWLTRDGTPRRTAWRAYHLTAPARECEFCGGGGRLFDKSERGRKCGACQGEGRISKRQRMTSVTTLLDQVTAKGGLVPWAEANGIRGTVEAVRRGLITGETVDPVQVVRANRLGQDAAKQDAATRGLNVHALLEEYMRTGAPPSPGQHPEAHRAYIRALAGWLAKYDPEPVHIEHIVACPDHGYAGRLDLVCDIAGVRHLVDLKTQERGGIYSSAHVQTAMYRRALRDTDGDEVTCAVIVALAADGAFRQVDCLASDGAVEAACAWYRLLAPIESACSAQNEAERRTREEAIAA